MLGVGDIAPDFEARRPDGTPVKLSDLRGRHVLVYFYPKDSTPGCTTEACGLNDSLGDLQGSGAEVIGVSFDTWESHHKFQERYGLGFALASDTDRRIAAAYGVGKMLGLLPVARRQSFLVAPDGVIERVWSAVSVRNHAADVLEAVRNSPASAGREAVAGSGSNSREV